MQSLHILAESAHLNTEVVRVNAVCWMAEMNMLRLDTARLLLLLLNVDYSLDCFLEESHAQWKQVSSPAMVSHEVLQSASVAVLKYRNEVALILDCLTKTLDAAYDVGVY